MSYPFSGFPHPKHPGRRILTLAIFNALAVLALFSTCRKESPVATVSVAFAPNVPPPTNRSTPTTVRVYLNSTVAKIPIAPGVLYEAWTFNDHVPGPLIRARRR